MAQDPFLVDRPYLRAYSFWLTCGSMTWIICWKFGEWFTLRISGQIHEWALHRILRAPIDKFFDKHPVGRIINRLAADLAVVDLFLFMKSTSTITVICQTLIPLTYIHAVLPWLVSFVTLPLYCL